MTDTQKERHAVQANGQRTEAAAGDDRERGSDCYLPDKVRGVITVAMLIIILATIADTTPRWIVWTLITLIGLETAKALAAEARRERKFLEESK